ncbi:MAG: Nif3-like dinuclear metal center hexameric protein, partial [Planctomycetota bacterium]|nr:Nif3-like dinuclear metal center hexameric protein [Planctomycetota bacterium]
MPVLDEAKRREADLLVVHHPRFYHGLSRLSPDDPSGRRAIAIARSGLAIYAAHTNLDCAPGGVNEVLAARSGLPPEAKVIEETYQEKILKLAVFVPASHVDKVRAALG